MNYDVAVIGGGPGGSTLGGILRQYSPETRVAIFEKEHFPREHIGESLLPTSMAYLYEMGLWDRMEAAEFPIKVGATYRWGATQDLWDFEFINPSKIPTTPRPHRYEGTRRATAFQVDRAKYDKILLDNARERGCEVFEGVKVAGVERDGDRVAGLRLADGRKVTARWYADASGHVGILRRAMGVGVTVPTALMNIAIWDYWVDAEWAVTIGAGGTRIQVMSLDHGWMWFIPISPTRTSLGYVCPLEYYKTAGLSAEELYRRAISVQPRIKALVASARRENDLRTTKDWSFVSDRVVGENWFLVGESAGFADPILSGGVTLAHAGAREAAHIIIAIDRKDHDPGWLKKHYNDTQRRRVMQYIRFADFWYAFNGNFNDLREITKKIAEDAGFSMTPQMAFRWLSFGGFSHEDFALPGLGGLDLLAVKECARMLTSEEFAWEINKHNTFRLNLLGADPAEQPIFHAGKIVKARAYRRGGKMLVMAGVYGIVADILRHASHIHDIAQAMINAAESTRRDGVSAVLADQLMSALESMVVDGWVTGKLDPKKPKLTYLPFGPDNKLSNFHPNRDPVPATATDQAGRA